MVATLIQTVEPNENATKSKLIREIPPKFTLCIRNGRGKKVQEEKDLPLTSIECKERNILSLCKHKKMHVHVFGT